MAIDVVMKGRTSQGTIAWAIALLLVPWVSLPFYLVLGDRKFSGYVLARRRGKGGIETVATTLTESLRPFVTLPPDDDRSHRAFSKLARLPFTSGNQVDLLIDGSATFDAIMNAIELATNYIVVQFYIFRDDGLGQRLQQALLTARKRGVRIYLLYDEIGSYWLTRSYIQVLRDAGCECSGFRTKLHKQRPFRINFRNHRKIVICDGRVAFVGGHNVGDEYLGLHKKLTPWRDTHAGLRGPAVQCVQLAFLEDWYWATRTIPELEWTPRAVDGPGANVLIVPSSPADDLETCSLLHAQVANSARSRLWMASPYFVPDEELVGALQLAALRAVDVAVIIPEKPDRVLPLLSAFTYYDEIIPTGVKIYRYRKGFPHQKVVLSDDLVCVGTANLDNRSFRINFEITVVVSDSTFAGQVAEMLKSDVANSRVVAKEEFRNRSFWFRFACRVSRLLAPIQ
ncbi:MAG: cardiolipin synthase [Pyrinomonadaceae bacterium]|nr:cardiolipin synthase [Phycisphaerales bacterium]